MIVRTMKRLGIGFAAAAALCSNSFAALPASVTADAATTAADALTLGGIVLGIVIAIALFKHLRSAK